MRYRPPHPQSESYTPYAEGQIRGKELGYAAAVADVARWLRINPATIETSLLAERLESGEWKGTKP